MEMQIETGLYERQGITTNKTTNYHEHLPAPQSDLARDILKDPLLLLAIDNKAIGNSPGRYEPRRVKRRQKILGFITKTEVFITTRI